VQDIYPLAPLQEGILFHHLLEEERDPYLLATLLQFEDEERLKAYVQALQKVIERNDILRTSVAWEGLSEPVQVVWRQAQVQVEELSVASGNVQEGLRAAFESVERRLDVRRAPLLRLCKAWDEARGRWVVLQQMHHLCGDHSTLDVISRELESHLLGRSEELGEPVAFRNFVARARLGVSREEHEAFFAEQLGDVEECTAPFGLMDVQKDGGGVEEARRMLEPSLSRGLRERARALGVSAASMCHVAWGQVLSRASGREDVVFGTVLLGRMQGGENIERAMGLFINTLPVRLRLGEQSVRAAVKETHVQLTKLMRHEHASLALAQRQSGVVAPAPLFTALLNYRHGASAKERGEAQRAWQGIEFIGAEERTNYPLAMSVDDFGDRIGLAAQAPAAVGAERVGEMMMRALEELVLALERAPETPVSRLDVLPRAERQRLLVDRNATDNNDEIVEVAL
jgi:hypothetical protein